MTIYIYDNVTGQQVASHAGIANADCEQWANDNWGSNDYHWDYHDVPVSNAVETECATHPGIERFKAALGQSAGKEAL